MKVLTWDGTGVVLPKATRVGDQHIVVSDAIFDVIFKGVRMAPKQRKRRLH